MDRVRDVIWGGPPPPPELGRLVRRGTQWWEQYSAGLAKGPVRNELELSSCTIVELLPDPQAWGDAPTPFKGLVVGAVQSGKTASMIGVSAVALDQGFKLIIVLAGLKDDLRRQTARRFNAQLLRQSDPVEGADGVATLDAPVGPGPLGGFALNYYFDANFVPTLQIQMERALNRGEPCVIVVKKNAASLRELGKAMRVVYRRHRSANVPTLVLDDECDEASVATPTADRTVPTVIASLWASSGPTPNIAYVGYTATAAASLLQDPSNALFPSHFVQMLRYPAADDGPLTYSTPNGDSWYTGGATYYGQFGDEPGESLNFLVSPTVTATHLAGDPGQSPSLYDALVAWFVGGAFRLALQPERRFDDPQRLPAPHSMMVQTSTSIDDHRAWRDAICSLLAGVDVGDGIVMFDDEALMRRVEAEEVDWRAWHDRFSVARDRIYAQSPHAGVQKLVDWEELKAALPDVFRNATLKIVNSDGGEGQTLDYSPDVSQGGRIVPQQDVYVIAVGGSKLSRGLTIEGLCVTYYTRSSIHPFEDTTLQTSRWFGYRGSYLEFCRLFTNEDTYERLADIQASDLDHRLRLADLMERGESLERARLALRTSPTGTLTAKLGVGTIHDLAFSPSTHLYSHIETGALARANQQAAQRIARQIEASGVEQVGGESGRLRGLISRGWTAAQVADLLDSFEYSDHNPYPDRYPMPELYKRADPNREDARLLGTSNDPYVAAAYLRYWARESEDAPRFNVGVTFGQTEVGNEPFDFPLLNRKISPSGRLEGAWSGRSGEWRGDTSFDNPDESCVSPVGIRARGCDGLVLLHVVHKDARGRSGAGIARECHSPAFGLVIPTGGPTFSVVVNYPL